MTGIDKKTAVITGAAGCIEQAISRQFVEKGFRVVAGDLDQVGLNRLEAELNLTGQNVWARAGDLRSKDYCEDLIEYSVQATGRLDMLVLVNNAGIITRGNILTTTGEDWERTFEVSLSSIFHTSRKAIGHMKRHGGGAIVNVAYYWGAYPGPLHAVYWISKAALAAFSKCLGREHASDGIRGNAVYPNEINTPMLRTGSPAWLRSVHSRSGGQQYGAFRPAGGARRNSRRW
ncbi:SDR family oxidoreductase [Mesorhizobium sp.]|uniref:SDR family NAD(P)-dependent oxidoreductase n=1 Tax=Mesorhizobium sp. TaxID=1871066 RepID=UPI0025BDA6B9|nr:SDR family oxidoreductase [Mesorhizobium sp.]